MRAEARWAATDNAQEQWVETIVLVVVVVFAALILFSRFALGVEFFQCMESHGARVDCLQRIVVNHANQRF